MAKQTFTAGQVLTAAEMNSLQENDYNWTVTTKTASYTLAAGDEGTRIVMNNAGATTITVDDAVFAAGDTVWVHNIGAGTCTITAGTATVSTVGELALEQYAGGHLYFTSASAAIFFPTEQGGGGGLVFISRTTIGSAVSSVTVSGAFSTDYDNYKIVVSGGTASTSSNLLLTLGSTVTGYYQAGRIVNYAATTSDIHDQNVANWRGGVGGVTLSGDVTLYGPYASDYTGISTLFFGTRGDAYEGYLGGYLADTTSYTAFTLAASTGTITGGSIDLYGYAKA